MFHICMSYGHPFCGMFSQILLGGQVSLTPFSTFFVGFARFFKNILWIQVTCEFYVLQILAVFYGLRFLLTIQQGRIQCREANICNLSLFCVNGRNIFEIILDM